MEQAMCQRNVERVIGRLVTDEAFLRRFTASPTPTLRDLEKVGIVLTECELDCLARTETETLGRIAQAIDPKLRKAALRTGQEMSPECRSQGPESKS
jgi:hypothetical protein